MIPTKTLSLKHLTRFPTQPAQTHPTIICLHGRGSHEGDLLGLAQYLDDRLLWISPRAPLDLMGGYEWYRIEAVGKPEHTSFTAALAALDRFTAEAVTTYPVDPQRLFLLGFSQGSIMSCAFTLTQPARVAGVIAQSGYLPLKSGLKIDEAGLKGKPFILTHGVFDTMIPIQAGQAARDGLTHLGADVEYHEFPMGHAVTDESLAVIAAWLKKQLA